MRKCAVLFAAAMVLAVMCGIAYADEFAIDRVYEEHFTLSELTSDYKAHYGADSRTRFGCFHLHIAGMNNIIEGDSLTITPNGPVFVGYVKSGDYFDAARSVRHNLSVKLPYLQRSDLISSNTLSSAVTHRLVGYKRGGNNISDGELLIDDAGNMPIFGVLGDTATEAALAEADYSVTIEGVRYTGKLGRPLTTAQQVSSTAVPYVELKADANGKLQSVTWRAVKASDPSVAVAYTNRDDISIGMFAKGYIKTHIYLKDGSEVGDCYPNYEEDHFHGSYYTKVQGKKMEATERAPFGIWDESQLKYIERSIDIADIAAVVVRDDGEYQWVFYPKQQSSGGGGDPNNGNNNDNGNTSETPVDIAPGDVSGTPSAGSNVSDVTCGASGRPTPAELVSDFRNAIANAMRISRITFLNTLTITVSYVDITNVPIGATVTINIANFSYPEPKGRLYALAKNKSDGVWRRFPITRGANGINFELPVRDYFSSSEIVIADIEDKKSSGSACSAGAAVLAALAALAVMKRRSN